VTEEFINSSCLRIITLSLHENTSSFIYKMNMELPESSMQEVFVDKSHAQPFLDLPSE
jgi:hypothetical protein